MFLYQKEAVKVRQLLNQVSIEDRLWFVNMHILIFDLAGV